MKTIAVLPNRARDLNLTDTKEILKKLSIDIRILTKPEYTELAPYAEFCDEPALYNKCDMVLALGGDGTLLSAARAAAPYEKPVLGVNFGSLGFLTGSEKEYFLENACDVVLGKHRIEERMMLGASVIRDGEEISSYIALNDIALTRSTFSKLVSISITVDGDFVDMYTADGIVVSTPTGSTAYSLSAGGPILDPGLEAVVITPVCPHMLHSRPIVLSPEKVITLEVCDFKSHECAITADGQEGAVLQNGDIVKIEKSPYVTRLIRLQDTGFYEVLRNKMHS